MKSYCDGVSHIAFHITCTVYCCILVGMGVKQIRGKGHIPKSKRQVHVLSSNHTVTRVRFLGDVLIPRERFFANCGPREVWEGYDAVS